MPAPTITPLPTPPSRQDDGAAFIDKSDAFLGAFPQLQAEINTFGTYVDDTGSGFALSVAEVADLTAEANNSAAASAQSAAEAADSAALAGQKAAEAADSVQRIDIVEDSIYGLSGNSVKDICELLLPQQPYNAIRRTLNMQIGPKMRLGADYFVVAAPVGPVDQPTVDSWFTDTADSHAAIIVVKGDLDVPEGVTLTPIVRKPFMALYVDGNLTVNGTITMTARGANHSLSGSNIPAADLIIASGTFGGLVDPRVPAIGGAGALPSTTADSGRVGGNGVNGGTGGGGSGRKKNTGTTKAGAAGSVFGGGSGAGGARSGVAPDDAEPFGGKGGDGTSDAGGGAGNPPGTVISGLPETSTGTGGVLLLFVTGTLSGLGEITALGMPGSSGGALAMNGGGSGGGSITIFAESNNFTGSLSALGGNGGNNTSGGAGTARLLLTSTEQLESTWYVSATGTDSNAGTELSPWSLLFAASGAGGKILPGDTVLLLDSGGVYNNIFRTTINVGGVAGSPVTFKAAPGNSPVLDGSHPEFRVIGNNAWEPDPDLFAPGVNIYRSVNTFPAEQGSFAIGGKIKFGEKWYALAHHANPMRLAATTETWATAPNHYMGYGFSFSNGRYYVRLDPPSSEAMNGRTTIPVIADVDPRQHDLRINTGNYSSNFGGTGISFNAPWIVFGEGISVNNHYILFSVQPSANNCIIHKTAECLMSYMGVDLYGKDVQLNDMNINGSYNPEEDGNWISFYDVKGGGTPANWNRCVGIRVNALATGLRINGGHWKNLFDGMTGDTTNAKIIGGLWEFCADDQWQMSYSCNDIEITGVTFLGAGPSRDSTNSGTHIKDRKICIHHNIIDNSKNKQFLSRAGRSEATEFPQGVARCIVLSRHGAMASAWNWQLYNNTIIMGFDIPQQNPYIQTKLEGPAKLGDGIHAIFNNIIFTTISHGKGVLIRNGAEIYDGNVFFRGNGTSIWRSIADSTNWLEATGGVTDLNAFRASVEFEDSKAYWSRGWESTGLLDVDPQLDANYVPQNVLMTYGAVDLTWTGWPGTEVYRPYRGAIDPSV